MNEDYRLIYHDLLRAFFTGPRFPALPLMHRMIYREVAVLVERHCQTVVPVRDDARLLLVVNLIYLALLPLAKAATGGGGIRGRSFRLGFGRQSMPERCGTQTSILAPVSVAKYG